MIVEVEGVKLEVENKPPSEGELYVAERNMGKQLLTAKQVDYTNGWIVPVEKAYLYDIWECKRVIKML